VYVEQITGVLLALTIISQPKVADHPIQEARITNDRRESLCLAVKTDDLYYTIIIKNGIVQKFELNGNEEPNHIIFTNWEQLSKFATEFPNMSWMDKIKFLTERLNVPLEYTMDLMAMGVYTGETA